MSLFRKLTRVFVRLVAVILLLLLSAWLLLQTDPVQNWLIGKATSRLSRDLGVQVGIRHVNFVLFRQAALQGLLVRDRDKDTLLYAGALKVDITDFFFVKKDIDLKYIHLEDAVVNLRRSDSAWNYQFLMNYFSNPHPDTTRSGPSIGLKEVLFENVRVAQVDKWTGQDMIVDIGGLHLLARDVNTHTKKVDIDEVTASKLSFYLGNYPGLRPDSPARRDPEIVAPGGKPRGEPQWNPGGWDVSLNRLRLSDCRFQNVGIANRPLYTWFDPQHIDFNHIDARLNQVRFQKDTLSATIADLSTRERSGFTVKRLVARVRFTPKAMEFRQLDITTNQSRIRDYFAMRYNDFSPDLGDFVNKVNMRGDFRNAIVASDDIAFFAPDLKPWKKSFELTGHAEGPVADLKGRDLSIKMGATTALTGDFSMTGLPDIDHTQMSFKLSDLRTTFEDVTVIVPALKQIQTPNLRTLKSVDYKGTFSGFISDFVINGTARTGLGTVESNLNLRFPSHDVPWYKGKITVTDFDLGAFTGIPVVGRFSFDGAVDGRGFAFDDLNASLNGQIAHIMLYGYDYQNVAVGGAFKKKLFDGTLSVDDPNAEFSLDGKVQLDKTLPIFDFTSDITRLNFQPLGLLNRNLTLQGKMALDFTGRNIDDFRGKARLYNANLSADGEPVAFDSLLLESDTIANGRYLSLQSLPVTARIEGQYHILDLPKVVQWYLGKYYPAYIPPIPDLPSKEDFTFRIHTDDVEDYLDLLGLPMTGFDNSDLSGRISTKAHLFNLEATVPEFTWKQFDFNDIDIKSQGNEQKIHLDGTLGEIVLSDSLRLPLSRLTIDAHDDSSVIALQTGANQNLTSASLLARIHSTADSITARFDSSSFILNDKRWVISSDGEIAYRKNWIGIQRFRLSSGNEQIGLSTHPSDADPSRNDIDVALNDVAIEELLPMVLIDPHMEGSLSGDLTIGDPFGSISLTGKTKIDRFRFETDSIGTVLANASYGNGGAIHLEAHSDNPSYRFDAGGDIHLEDPSNQTINTSVNLDGASLHLLERYLGFMFSDMEGKVTGKLQITGNLNHPQVLGKVNVRKGILKVNYTQCKYLFDNEDIDFLPGSIDFGTITLSDTLNNHAILEGTMQHDFFKNMRFNMRVNTDRLLVLNTTARDNRNFYGTAIARVSASLTGPESNILLNITRAEAVDSSHIYLPNGNTKASALPDFIVFREYGKEMSTDEATPRYSSNFTVNMNLQVTSLAKIDVILDEADGDVVRAQGNGNLLIRTGTTIPMTINGTYNIESGSYTYSYTNLAVKKPFALSAGNIRWTGDPWEAYININASYEATDVTMPFTTSTGSQISQTTNVIILCHLTNTLSHPDVSFELKLPDDNPYKSDPIVMAQLKRFQDDPNEMSKQVFYLLLFDSFVADQDVASQQNNVNGGTLVAGTVGQVVAGQLSATLRSVIKKVLKDNTIDPYITLNPGFALQNNQANSIVTNASRFGINKSIMNGKIVFKLGTSVDYSTDPEFAQKNTDLLWSPDIALQWAITADGRVHLTSYNRTIYDVTYGRYNRTGVGINYRQDFDALVDLFASDRKRRKRALPLSQSRPPGVPNADTTPPQVLPN